MPTFLVADDLAAGRLVALTGKYLPGNRIGIVAARRGDRSYGPIAQRLWAYIEDAAHKTTSLKEKSTKVRRTPRGRK